MNREKQKKGIGIDTLRAAARASARAWHCVLAGEAPRGARAGVCLRARARA